MVVGSERREDRSADVIGAGKGDKDGRGEGDEEGDGDLSGFNSLAAEAPDEESVTFGASKVDAGGVNSESCTVTTDRMEALSTSLSLTGNSLYSVATFEDDKSENAPSAVTSSSMNAHTDHNLQSHALFSPLYLVSSWREGSERESEKRYREMKVQKRLHIGAAEYGDVMSWDLLENEREVKRMASKESRTDYMGGGDEKKKRGKKDKEVRGDRLVCTSASSGVVILNTFSVLAKQVI